MDPPVFILGAPRSGTSLLYKALCLHPEVAYISNYVRRWPRWPELSVLNRLAGRSPWAQRQVWFGGGSSAYVYGRRRPLRQRVIPMPHEGETVFEDCGIPEDPEQLAAITEEDRARLRQAIQRIVRAGGGRVFVSKRVGHNWRIPALLAVFPSARFVDITRDGRAVALSLAKVDWWDTSPIWWYGGTPTEWAAEGRDPWELCARHWVEEVAAIDRGLAAVPVGQQLRITYEDLVASPLTLLRQIAAFAGLAPSEDWERRLRALSYPNANEKWRDELGSEVTHLVQAVQARTLRARRYVA